jgi:signal peptidase II
MKTLSGEKTKYIFLLLTVLIVVVCDQVTKIYIEKTLALNHAITIIPNFLDIHHIRNTGAAFGIMSRLPDGARIPFLVGVSILAMILILYLFYMAEKNRTAYIFSLALVFSGAVGNLIDRVTLGFVRDFVDLHIYHLHWPVFNVADSAITVGIIIMAYEILIVEPRREKEKGGS